MHCIFLDTEVSNHCAIFNIFTVNFFVILLSCNILQFNFHDIQLWSCKNYSFISSEHRSVYISETKLVMSYHKRNKILMFLVHILKLVHKINIPTGYRSFNF